MKKLTKADLKEFRDRLYLPIPRHGSSTRPSLPPFFHPGEDSAEIEYMLERRRRARRLAARSGSIRAKPLKLPGDEVVRRAQAGLRQAGRSPPRWRSSGCSRT